MAKKLQKSKEPNKRKRDSGPKREEGKPNPKKLKKLHPSNVSETGSRKKPSEHHQAKVQYNKDDPESKKKRRLQAKELAEARKKKRKKHYTLQQELSMLWEKMRRRDITKEDRSKCVLTGGADGILHSALDEKLGELHERIASLVAEPKSGGAENDHLLEDFHSSRTIRKLILDCPAFADTLWEEAFKDKCALWAQGHSSRVIGAFLEASDLALRYKAEKELQPLVDSGVLGLTATKQTDLGK